VKFIDEARITVQSGNGGKGCVSFRRERFIPRGGPDGGDGGKGGDIILKATLGKRTLHHFQFRRLYRAKDGTGGSGSNRAGKGGGDLILEVPVGTLVFDTDSQKLLKDIVTPGETFIVACGGRGGRGNARFKSSTNRSPRYAQPGEPGKTLNLRLELKLLADVGLVGLPNAGKSTLIAAMSAANPKIGHYPFTTLSPNLGVVQTDWGEPFVVADIPGLIEGAHKGAGLGIRFLRHIERTRLLVHLIDADTISMDDPMHDYRVVKGELSSYDKNLAAKKSIVVINKIDLEGAMERVQRFKQAAHNSDDSILAISAKQGDGIEKLKSCILRELEDN
jgi:GTP-binding protein